MNGRAPHRGQSRGQSLVEFALILPIFLMLLVGLFDLGHVVWANNAISTATREATRFAIVHGGNSTTCPVGPHSATQAYPWPASSACPFPSDSVQAIKEEAAKWLSGVGGAANVWVCYGDVTTCSSDQNTSDNARGNRVTVTIQVSVALAAPSLLGLGDFTLSATNTMLVNH
jgi:hypothetical protein